MDERRASEKESDSVWDRITKFAGIAPIQGEPTTDPAGEMWRVAEQAGWSKEGGHDSLQGIGDMAVGNVDATQELEANSATEGGPLELADGESAFDDRHDTGIMTMELDEEDKNVDWCAYL